MKTVTISLIALQEIFKIYFNLPENLETTSGLSFISWHCDQQRLAHANIGVLLELKKPLWGFKNKQRISFDYGPCEMSLILNHPAILGYLRSGVDTSFFFKEERRYQIKQIQWVERGNDEGASPKLLILHIEI